ncbi:helix-turn-helix domain-containing protein [Alcaligenaceae bacterium]|uniref:helix-turn-helix transcriptional regulator n=1 Tax=Alcaligenes sp. HNGD-HTN06 TaxID=3416924 RepID=UPI0015D25AF6|nr:helix-turn-helix domain-containing protein [Alcaligenaceae bacterium]
MTTPAAIASAQPTPIPISLLEDQFVDMGFIARYTGLTDKWFYQLIKEGKFPKPVKFGRRSRWLKSELETWIQERIQESRAA